MSNTKKSVLLTGAGGSIGREIVKQLVASGQYELRVFDLDNPRNREFFDRYEGALKVYFGDITNPESLVEPTTDVDVVLHMASVIPPLAHDRPELAQKVNVEGTKNLINQLEQHSPNAFIAIASSVATYGDRLLDPYIKVSDPLTPAEGDNYAETKIAMERLVQESKLRWTVYRLAAIMGVGNHHVGKLMFRMPLEQIMEIATPRDTARAFVYTLEYLDEVEGKIFNLGGGAECTTTYGEFLAKNFEIFGLGALDFPSHAFATKNFHCGYYEDGQELEDILHFRRDTLTDYYQAVGASIPWIARVAAKATRKIVKSYLLSKSEPYKAWVEQDEEAMQLYFREPEDK